MSVIHHYVDSESLPPESEVNNGPHDFYLEFSSKEDKEKALERLLDSNDATNINPQIENFDGNNPNPLVIKLTLGKLYGSPTDEAEKIINSLGATRITENGKQLATKIN